eukprot:CAMPEP_0172819418 /NCGR_PEP_ID=MMETSP1075-20121228/14581_1 /TAXON_ID=2916 /ORGANISM="Ceratium fusus, Strain PA161109" /LENGTH=210 /DNA_ID=CAMNT_0013659939 /DNA_START=50 /DNA_END=679 /DNA_ORIENTATION=-
MAAQCCNYIEYGLRSAAAKIGAHSTFGAPAEACTDGPTLRCTLPDDNRNKVQPVNAPLVHITANALFGDDGTLSAKLAEPYMLDESKPIEKRKQVFMFYGTFSRSMLTMFEITLGNWMPPCRALVENVSEWFMLIFLTHKLVIGFSVVSVINAVFVQETFKVATSDDRIMLMLKQRARKTHMNKIRDLFQHADCDGNGTVTLDELDTAFS